MVINSQQSCLEVQRDPKVIEPAYLPSRNQQQASSDSASYMPLLARKGKKNIGRVEAVLSA